MSNVNKISPVTVELCPYKEKGRHYYNKYFWLLYIINKMQIIKYNKKNTNKFGCVRRFFKHL